MEKVRDKFTSQLEKIKSEYSADFIESLIKIKITLIIIFITITIIYLSQEDELVKNGNIRVYTMLHSPEYLKKLISLASLDGIFGALSFIFVLGSRGGWENVGTNIARYLKEILLTAVILFLFRFSQESSGFNRWMSPNSKIYREMDKIEMKHFEKMLEDDAIKAMSTGPEPAVLTQQQKTDIITKVKTQYSTDMNDLKKVSEYTFVQPFGFAVEKTAIGVTGLFVSFYAIKMLIATLYGYSSDAHGLAENNISGAQFTSELFMMFILNTIPSMLAPVIYDEDYKGSDVLMACGMGGASVVIHTLFQYAGLYQGLGENN
jgi:hypothetical protein